MNVTIQKDLQKSPLKVLIIRALRQLVRFGWEQALSCLFPVVIFASLAFTHFYCVTRNEQIKLKK